MINDFNQEHLRREGNDIARKYYDWNTQIDDIDAFLKLFVNICVK